MIHSSLCIVALHLVISHILVCWSRSEKPIRIKHHWTAVVNLWPFVKALHEWRVTISLRTRVTQCVSQQTTVSSKSNGNTTLNKKRASGTGQQWMILRTLHICIYICPFGSEVFEIFNLPSIEKWCCRVPVDHTLIIILRGNLYKTWVIIGWCIEDPFLNWLSVLTIVFWYNSKSRDN